METRNGRMRPATATIQRDDDAERILTTKGVTIAYEHPMPRRARQAWRCAGADPELFFPDDAEALETARGFCHGCDLRVECRALGLARAESGVWGGVLLEAGKVLEKPRKPGRPRKGAA